MKRKYIYSLLIAILMSTSSLAFSVYETVVAPWCSGWATKGINRSGSEISNEQVDADYQKLTNQQLPENELLDIMRKNPLAAFKLIKEQQTLARTLLQNSLQEIQGQKLSRREYRLTQILPLQIDDTEESLIKAYLWNITTYYLHIKSGSNDYDYDAPEREYIYVSTEISRSTIYKLKNDPDLGEILKDFSVTTPTTKFDIKPFDIETQDHRSNQTE